MTTADDMKTDQRGKARAKRRRLPANAANFDSAYVGPRTPVTLGFGDYVSADGNDAARFVFAETLWNVVPEAKEALLAIARSSSVDDAAVRDWAAYLNISDAWFIEGATELVHAWRAGASEDLSWAWPASTSPTTQWASPRAWNPILETEALFDMYIASYKREVRAAAEAAGLVAAPIKRNPEAQFRWLVLHQVRNMTYPRIAEMEQSASGLTESSVGQAIQSLASMLGLRLRLAPGR